MHAAHFLIGSYLCLTWLAVTPAASARRPFRLLTVAATSTCTPVSAGAPAIPAQAVPPGSPPFEPPGGGGPELIREVLRLEARALSPKHAIAVKRSGLKHVRNLSDLRLLASSAFHDPNGSYRRARSEFIGRNIVKAVATARAHGEKGQEAVREIVRLEEMSVSIKDALAIKTAGLSLVRNVSDFNALSRPAFASPSSPYLYAVSEFVTKYSGRW